jgi:hypothetical protein
LRPPVRRGVAVQDLGPAAVVERDVQT